MTESEEQSVVDSIDAGEWNASQSGRYKQVTDVPRSLLLTVKQALFSSSDP